VALLAASVTDAGGGMADGGQRAGTARGQAFDLATQVQGGPERFTAEVDPGWSVAGRPNGGYLLALATRAALKVAGQPHPLAVSAHFLAPADLGPAELAVERLRAGRTLATTSVTVIQEGAARMAALVTAGRLDPDAGPGWRRDGGPPAMPPVEACLPARPELPGGVPVPLLHHLELRMDPATTGWFAGRPGGSLDMRGWVRFSDGRPADPLALLQMADALPAPGWLACVVRGQLWQGGWFDEQAEVWDSAGRLVAQARQFAGARPADPSAEMRELW
jgi:acyl-CoA thioesterase